MSYSSSGGGRHLPSIAPEKGVFPLDHFGECKKVPPRPPPLSPSQSSSAGGMLSNFALLVSSRAPLASQLKDQYLACLRSHASQAEACRGVTKAYLECRMSR